MTHPILAVGMEELPNLYAQRLSQAGWNANALTGRGWKNLFSIMRSSGLIAVYPLPFWKHIKLASLWGKPTLAVWIGSDVWRVINEPQEKQRFYAAQHHISTHIADSPQLIEELKELGVEATWVPTISEKMHYQPLPVPQPPHVLVYLTKDRHQFYGSKIIREVAERLPQVRFLCVGGYDFTPDPPANIQCAGYLQDMEEVYQRSFILLRPTLHDGLSQMVLEALGRARHVIWSSQFPHCHPCPEPEQVCAVITELLEEPKPNMEGAEYVAESFTPQAMISRLSEVAATLWHKSR